MSALITAPEGYDSVKDTAHASKVLRYLLTTYPNTWVTGADVIDVLGYHVGATAVSNAARRLREGAFGLNLRTRSGHHGGYMLLVPVPSTHGRRCGNCRSCSVIGTCREMKGRPVSKRETCGAWS